MKALIKRNLNGGRVLFLFLLANAVYATMLLYSIPSLMAFSGGLKIMDMLPGGYDLLYVRSLFSALGEAGRNFYLTVQLPLDLVYPGLFGISYALLLAYLLKKLGKLQSRYFYLVYLPLLGGFFDYLENIGILTLLTRYPDLTNGLVQVTSFFTVSKSVISSLFFVSLFILLLIWGARFLFKPKNQNLHAKPIVK